MSREFTDSDLQWQPILEEPMGRNFQPNQFMTTSPTYSPYYGYYNPILPLDVVANGGGTYGSPLGKRYNPPVAYSNDESPYYLNNTSVDKNQENKKQESTEKFTNLFNSIPPLLPTANPMVLLFLIIILVMLSYIHSCQMAILHEIRSIRNERLKTTV